MQRKQQVGECWVCVIFFVRLDLVFSLCWECVCMKGGSLGGRAPLFGGSSLEKRFFGGFLHKFLVVFNPWFSNSN
jgi:hypothetical protein